MAVNTDISEVTAVGNSSATSFPFTDLILQTSSSELSVYLVDTDGSVTKLVEGTGANKYAVVVSSYPNDGSVTYPTSGAGTLSASQKLIMKRELPLLQGATLGFEGGYSSTVQESLHDQSRMIDIQQQEEIDRALKVPMGDGTDPDDYLDDLVAATTAAAAASTAAAAASAAGAAAAVAGGVAAAAASATTATTQATNAGNSATAAAGSATAASGSATTASTQATNAAASAVAAAASAAAAAASANAFYDTPFNAGYASDMSGLDLVAGQNYGEIVVARAFTATGSRGIVTTAPTGAAITLDIKKNGTSIYSVLPSFAATTGTFSGGTLKSDGTQIFAAGDKMTFRIVTVGSGTKGQQLMFTLRGGL